MPRRPPPVGPRLGARPAPRGLGDLTRLADLPADTCWLWTGAKTPAGYGLTATGSAHRAVWERLRGRIPAGLELDHLCENRDCVNPAHLEPVTKEENGRRRQGKPQARDFPDDFPWPPWS